ncbi:winged helix-turn-helix transcriptional regulator [Halohasta salina]|uniref:winged helix-turn-helix transcriptional regulator n=1 Tax=Halohasta salina TaxID=2961621 RepID=UPI0020A533E9|nr:helix-turn-helix domain-containing protein [Halohasta salina]
MATNCSTHGRQYATDTAAQGTLIEMASIIGHKWYPVILNELCVEDDRGFSDLHDSIDGVSNKMLSDSLSALENRGLVDRAVVSDKPVRVRYTLTDAGHDLETVLAAMLDWGQANLDHRETGSTPTTTVGTEPVAAAVSSGGHSTGADQ